MCLKGQSFVRNHSQYSSGQWDVPGEALFHEIDSWPAEHGCAHRSGWQLQPYTASGVLVLQGRLVLCGCLQRQRGRPQLG